jgi:hypothetical protein
MGERVALLVCTGTAECRSGALLWPQVDAVGGWWNRRFDPEVDLGGADRSADLLWGPDQVIGAWK